MRSHFIPGIVNCSHLEKCTDINISIKGSFVENISPSTYCSRVRLLQKSLYKTASAIIAPSNLSAITANTNHIHV